MRVAIYVQARMGSTRLPEKVLMPVLGRPLLLYLMERLQRVTGADACVVLTTTLKQDDAIEAFCATHGYQCFRGDNENVLSRYYHAALQYRPDAIVRVTGDCPVIDPGIADKVIDVFRQGYPKLDYVSNTLERTYPRGLDVEIFSFKALERAFQTVVDDGEREHVTLHMYRHPESFRLQNVASPVDLSQYRWTVDTAEDFQLIKLIIENLYPRNPQFGLQDILDLFKVHPEWNEINAHVKQKAT